MALIGRVVCNLLGPGTRKKQDPSVRTKTAGLLDRGHSLVHVCHELGVIEDAARDLALQRLTQSRSLRTLSYLALIPNLATEDHHSIVANKSPSLFKPLR